MGTLLLLRVAVHGFSSAPASQPASPPPPPGQVDSGSEGNEDRVLGWGRASSWRRGRSEPLVVERRSHHSLLLTPDAANGGPQPPAQSHLHPFEAPLVSLDSSMVTCNAPSLGPFLFQFTS